MFSLFVQETAFSIIESIIPPVYNSLQSCLMRLSATTPDAEREVYAQLFHWHTLLVKTRSINAAVIIVVGTLYSITSTIDAMEIFAGIGICSAVNCQGRQTYSRLRSLSCVVYQPLRWIVLFARWCVSPLSSVPREVQGLCQRHWPGH